MNKLYFYLCFLAVMRISAQFDNTQLNKIDILQYDFKIQINDSTDFIKAAAQIKLVRKKPVSQLILNFRSVNASGKGMQVSGVYDSRQENLKFRHQNDSLTVFWPKNKVRDTLQIKIVYQGIPEDGLYIRRNKYDRRTFFGDNWPNRAQYWLPVIDHPSDKALVSWTVTAPKHYEVIASGRLISKIDGGNTYRFHYQTQVPIPTKVMVFAAADFSIKYFDKLYLDQHCVPVSSWIYAHSPITGFDDYKCSLRALKFYDSLLGPYVYQKLANVQSNTRFGGMENAGNIFYDENTVDGTKSVENLVAHEVAHQWFGNTVTEKNWRDIWLSEGFATYMTDLYLEQRYGVQKLKARMAMERQKVIRYNQLQRRPVVYDESQNLFLLLNPNSYEKGAWVLHMLRQKIGDKLFFKLLRTFYQTYRLKNAGTADFIALAEKVSGNNLKTFFNQWLYQDGLPVLKITDKIDSKKHLLHLHIEQMEAVYDLKLPVRIKWKGGQTDFVIKINRAHQDERLHLPENFDTKSYQLILDPDVQVLFKTIP